MKVDQCQIERLITPIVEAMGYIVWHIELHRVQRKILLRIYVDVAAGDTRKSISIDDCSNISSQIGGLLDAEGLFSGSYTLEVSSPGLNRSLFKPEHYVRYIGSMVHVVLREPIMTEKNEQRDFTGKISEVLANTLRLAVADKLVDVDITNVSRAKLILDL